MITSFDGAALSANQLLTLITTTIAVLKVMSSNIDLVLYTIILHGPLFKYLME